MNHQGRWPKFSLLFALLSGAALASPDFPAPQLNKNSLELENTATTISYNPAHKQADWVFYPLGPSQLRNCVNRVSGFRADPRLPAAEAAQLADYKSSGFDRGHLSPAGDNKFSQAAMDESFYLSNVSPQPPHFNRGIWSKLEDLVRAWAEDSSGLWVTTGPLLSGTLESIGDDQVSVPDFFYKVLSTRDGPKHNAVAFLLPSDASGELSRYAMTVKQLEDENEAKANMDLSLWDFQASFSYFPCNAISPAPWKWAWGLSYWVELRKSSVLR